MAKKRGFGAINVASAFRGINQAVDERYLKGGESAEAYNFRTDDGVLSRAPGYSRHIAAALPSKPVTPILYYNYIEDGTINKYMLAATGSDLYLWNGLSWVSIKGEETISSGDFSFVNFREEDKSKLILSNGIDPVYQWEGTGNIAKLYYEDETGKEAPRGVCLASHVERLWVGGVAGFPNTIFWSDDSLPTNWTSDPDQAGEATLQTWDGGHVIGLAVLLGDVVVFEPSSVFRVVGTYPTEFQPVQVLTVRGTIAPRSICEYNNRAYFVSPDGIMVYDTVKAYPLMPYELKEFWGTVNLSALSGVCGIAHDNRLYMAVPVGDSAVNNRVIEYNLINKTIGIRSGITVTRFLQDGDELLFTGPGNHIYRYNSGADYDGADIPLAWKTPSTMLGLPNRKYTYDVTVTGYSDDAGGGDVLVTLYFDGQESGHVQLTLPYKTSSVARGTLRGSGRLLNLMISNAAGSDVHIESIDLDVDVLEDL